MATEQNFELIAKKHWATFTIPTLVILLGLIFSQLSTFFKYFGIAMIVLNAIKIYSLTTVKWTLTSTDLYITKGILPWTKTQLQIPIFDIYESLVSYDMFGHIFGFGHITIRRTEGNTTQITETALTGAKNFSGYINQFVQDFKKNKHNVTIYQTTATKQSIREELKHLAELKNNGELTQDEYDKMKKILINRS